VRLLFCCPEALWPAGVTVSCRRRGPPAADYASPSLAVRACLVPSHHRRKFWGTHRVVAVAIARHSRPPCRAIEALTEMRYCAQPYPLWGTYGWMLGAPKRWTDRVTPEMKSRSHVRPRQKTLAAYSPVIASILHSWIAISSAVASVYACSEADSPGSRVSGSTPSRNC
jgi:hypothetical protein